jgi:hypothetical protein
MSGGCRCVAALCDQLTAFVSGFFDFAVLIVKHSVLLIDFMFVSAVACASTERPVPAIQPLPEPWIQCIFDCSHLIEACHAGCFTAKFIQSCYLFPAASAGASLLALHCCTT